MPATASLLPCFDGSQKNGPHRREFLPPRNGPLSPAFYELTLSYADCPAAFAIHSLARRSISAGATSSTCVATFQRCPKGSSNTPCRSPQNWFIGAITVFAPLATALLNTLSQSSK